ncbi:hypothetical protein [Foetidibacter luteolus]|uniref:hypothetical protein n=1 Tax=Foetidibacter luteolus TaxID=2608880 RepID=UPI00129ADEFE|nr:hypothetical protein [Foetidibacter luteolus]
MKKFKKSFGEKVPAILSTSPSNHLSLAAPGSDKDCLLTFLHKDKTNHTPAQYKFQPLLLCPVTHGRPQSLASKGF